LRRFSFSVPPNISSSSRWPSAVQRRSSLCARDENRPATECDCAAPRANLEMPGAIDSFRSRVATVGPSRPPGRAFSCRSSSGNDSGSGIGGANHSVTCGNPKSRRIFWAVQHFTPPWVRIGRWGERLCCPEEPCPDVLPEAPCPHTGLEETGNRGTKTVARRTQLRDASQFYGCEFRHARKECGRR
jgi:hypothetical protein